MAAWNGPYKGLIEYSQQHAARRECRNNDGEARVRGSEAAVLHVIRRSARRDCPRNRNGECEQPFLQVDFRNFESTRSRTSMCLAMRSSAPASRSRPHGKPARQSRGERVVAMLTSSVRAEPSSRTRATALSTTRMWSTFRRLHRYVAEKTMRSSRAAVPVAGPPVEGQYAFALARNIWADMLA